MRGIIALLVSIALFGLLSAAEYPELKGYVSDFADLLTDTEEARLDEIIRGIEENTTVEIALVTVKNTGGEDRILYANRVGEKNGVGKQATDNGVVILWSLDNEKGGAIATGRGIESILNDAKCGRIGRESRAYFDREEYYNGFEYILLEIKAEVENQDSIRAGEKEDNTMLILITIVLIVVLLIVILALMGGKSKKKTRKKKKESKHPYRATSYFGKSWGGGGWSSGSFGGFGGGSFGGGGARF